MDFKVNLRWRLLKTIHMGLETGVFSVRAAVNAKSNGGKIMSRKGENIYKQKDGRWEEWYIKSYNEQRKVMNKLVFPK